MNQESLMLTTPNSAPAVIDWCNAVEGVYKQESYTAPIGFDADLLLKRSEQTLRHQIAEATRDPSVPFVGLGPAVTVGIDCEWVRDPDSDGNFILSAQFFLVGEDGEFSKIFYTAGKSREGRLRLGHLLAQVIAEAMDAGAIREWPRQVVACGFFFRADLAAFADLPEFKNRLDSVGGSVASVRSDVTFDVPVRAQESFVTVQAGVLRRLSVSFIDMARHAPVGTTLDVVGEQIGLPKIELPHGMIERMDKYLALDKAGFEAYAIRDAEIAAKFYLRLRDAAKLWTGRDSLPATSSGLAVRLFRKCLDEAGFDFDAVFGKREQTSQIWDRDRNGLRTIKASVPNQLRAIHAPFVSSCYLGGRNECFAFGPSAVGLWNDFDLRGAYTTGLVYLKQIDYDGAFTTCDVENFTGHVAGFAKVRFAYPAGTRFPGLPVQTERNGLIFPLTGVSYCTAPEIEAALAVGCELQIQHGVVFPWKEGSDTRIFETFTTHIRDLRARYPKGSLDEQYAKLIGNGLYGKLAQGLHAKNVFDTRTEKSVELPHSVLTNEVMAAMATGFIRAVLAEVLAGLPNHRNVLSVTTDGFLTDATFEELDLSGPMATRFQTLCERVAPGSKMMELKHQVRQIVAMKTRGQLTGLPMEKGDTAVVLAKAGISPPVPKGEHNRWMLDLFMRRTPEDKTQIRPFVSLRQQWLDDLDLVRFDRPVRLNLEFDFKRCPVSPVMATLGYGEHLAFETVPWTTVEAAKRARVIFDEWRRKRCLKTLSDWESWSDFYQFTIARDRNRSSTGGLAILYSTEGSVGVMRRMFLRAYTQGAWGIKATMSYSELASWLTSEGYPTSPSEVKNAKRAKLAENLVPTTGKVLKLISLLKESFPSMDVESFLIQAE